MNDNAFCACMHIPFIVACGVLALVLLGSRYLAIIEEERDDD